MRVVVDTSVWSLVLRRWQPESVHAEELTRLLREGAALLLGLVRQELLSGIPLPRDFERLRNELRTLDDFPVSSIHHETAAEAFNTCRSRGIQGTVADLLLCGVSIIENLPIYSTDADFVQFARVLPIKLYTPQK